MLGLEQTPVAASSALELSCPVCLPLVLTVPLRTSSCSDTGPCFQPINTWLRNVGRVDDNTRMRLAKSPEFTYSATVRHLVDGIRKLARVGHPDLEAGTVLYRGVAGILNERFWAPDEMGFVCATELGFMSTSLAKHTPLHYMKTGPAGTTPNILWEIHTSDEDASGYHCGVSIALLSQYSDEQEVIFPPLTMLRVMARPKQDSPPEGLSEAEAAWSVTISQSSEEAAPGTQPVSQADVHGPIVSTFAGWKQTVLAPKAFKVIRVQPTFI